MNIQLVFNIVLLVSLIIYDVFISIKYKNGKEKSKLLRNEKLFMVFLVFFSILLYGVAFIINVKELGGSIMSDYFNSAIRSLNIFVLVFPFNLWGLHNVIFNKVSDKYSTVKTIVCSSITRDELKELNNGFINVIVISKKRLKDIDIRECKLDELTENDFIENLYLKEEDIHILDDRLDSNITMYVDNVSNVKSKIMKSRYSYDIYERIVKYVISVYGSLLFGYLILNIVGFPLYIPLEIILLVKVLMLGIIHMVFRKVEYDKDIDTRHPRLVNSFIGKQELLFAIFQGLISMFFMTIPYMLVLTEMGTLNSSLGFSLLLITFISSSIFLLISSLYDNFIAEGIFKFCKKFRHILVILVVVVLIFLINYPYDWNASWLFDTTTVGVKNLVSCILFGLGTICLNEFVKLARYFQKKGKKKNERKNNKKCR